VTLEVRFSAKCGKPDANGCIPWLAGKTLKGYGQFRIGLLRTTAHRAAWMMKYGDIAPGLSVLHKCDNPSCVNVDHLFLGTAQENTDDMVAKGRHAWRNGTPWQKLNATDAERIRDLYRARCTQQEIADWLGVSRPLISMILAGKIQYSTALTGV
jgi:HNH endonuclease